VAGLVGWQLRRRRPGSATGLDRIRQATEAARGDKAAPQQPVRFGRG
jgi:hypothetical protein